MSNKKPVFQLSNGRGLSVSIFANASEEGRIYYNTPGVENRYFDKKTEEWKSTYRLSEDDMPVASVMLDAATRKIWELRAQQKEADAANDASQPTAEVA